MGTRADFYMGRGEDAVWLGSIAWDGYPGGIPAEVLGAPSPDDYLAAIQRFWADRDDVTLPEHGWPWPWDTSHTTDFAYAFDGDRVWVSNYGDAWSDASQPLVEPEPVIFPDMSDQKNVTYGPRSGVMIITSEGLL